MEALAWLSTTPVAAALKASGTFYLLVNAAHILAIGLIVGAILPLDLRLIGALKAPPVATIGPLLSRTAGIGVAAAVATGLSLFSVRPQEYAENPAFLKVALIALGVLNAVVLHVRGGWRAAIATDSVPPLARVQALLSLTIWLGAVLAGRWMPSSDRALGVRRQGAPALVPEILLIDDDQLSRRRCAGDHLLCAGKCFLDGNRDRVAALRRVGEESAGTAKALDQRDDEVGLLADMTMRNLFVDCHRVPL